MKKNLTKIVLLTLNTGFLSLSWLSGIDAIAQNIGINGTGVNPHSSALLDVDDAGTNNKGILIPRIPLTAINASSPVTSPATSLLVYNTATANTGTNAVSPGYYYWDGIKWLRFQYSPSGSSSLDWSLTGNAGTVSGTNFIGTTDNQNLIFKRNSINSGLLSPLNTSFGYNSGGFVSLSAGNSAFGAEALMTVSGFGNSNAAFGYKALTLTSSGQDNSAFGSNSAQNNTTGRANSSFGMGSLTGNTTGAENVALGWGSGISVSTGLGNTLVGARADVAVGTYTNATAIGYNSRVAQSNALILGGTGADAVNVGLGITAPNAKLYIKDNIPVGSLDLVMENSAPSGQQWVLESIATYGSFSPGSFSIGNRTTSTNHIIINPAGKVGINNVAPTESLDIAGSVKIVDGTQAAEKVLTSDANGKGSWQDKGYPLGTYYGVPNTTHLTVLPTTEGVILSGIIIPYDGFFLFSTNTPVSSGGITPNSEIYLYLCPTSAPYNAYGAGQMNYFLYNHEARLSSNNVTEGMCYLTAGSYDVRILNNSTNATMTTSGNNFSLKSVIKL